MAKKKETQDVSDKTERNYSIADDGTIVLTTPKSVKRLKVDLDGEIYEVKPVKGQLGLTLSVEMRNAASSPEKIQKVVNRILHSLFDPADRKKIEKRLDDSDDTLDTWHIMELVEAVIEISTANPTM